MRGAPPLSSESTVKTLVPAQQFRFFSDVSQKFCLESPFLTDSVKDTEWEAADKEITLIVIPTVAPLPYDADIKLTILDDNFIKEMQAISPEHVFLG